MAVPDPPCVDETTSRLLDLLKRAREIKKSNGIDPALPAAEFAGDLGLPQTDASKHSHSVSVEISARRLFQGHVVSGINVIFPHPLSPARQPRTSTARNSWTFGISLTFYLSVATKVRSTDP